MADNTFNGTLKFTDDWGDVNGLPASGEAVQKFIKDTFDTKVGYTHVIDSETDSKLYNFASKENCEAWLQNAVDNLVIGEPVSIPKTKPQPYYVVSLTNKENHNTLVFTDNTVIINVNFGITYYADNGGTTLIPTDYQGNGTLQIEKLDSNNNWKLIHNETVSTGNLTIDLSSNAELTGTNTIRMSVETTPENNTQRSPWITFNVTKTQIDLSFSTNWSIPVSDNFMDLSYMIRGSVNKTLHIKVTGAGSKDSSVYRYKSIPLGTATYTDKSYLVKLTDSIIDTYKVTAPGIHNIESWLTVDIGGETVAETNHLFNQILMLGDDSNDKPYVIISDLNTNLSNWSNEKLFKYAVYHPTQTYVPITILLRDQNDDNNKYLEYYEIIETGRIYEYKNVIEVEGNTDKLYADLLIESDGVQLLTPTQITINNQGGYSPTAGADFIFNPRSKTNSVAADQLKVIKNNANNQIVPSTWDGFTFGNDGWVTDELGNRCLRVKAGQVLNIDYKPFVGKWLNDSCTIEMTVATRNIFNEDVPVMRICDYNNDIPNGWELKPLIGAFMLKGEDEALRLKRDIWIQEGEMTHIAINIRHQMVHNLDTMANGEYPKANLVRIYINGKINREFSYADDAADKVLYSTDDMRTIVFGDKAAGADIDIYNIRVYKEELNSADILQNYISQLPTTTQKETLTVKNDIMVDGKVNYEKVVGRYNTLVWAPRKAAGENATTRLATYGDDDTKFEGDLHITLYKEDGTLDESRSGVLYDMTTKGQGTSSMTYWKWNQRWEFGKIKDATSGDTINSYFVPSNATIGEDGVPTPRYKGKWQLADGMPWAKRLDGKINFASPMQSHKLGSVGMYNDLWKEVIANSEITAAADGSDFTGTEDGYKSCRVSIKQKPFFVFVKKTPTSTPEFYGLYTMGPSKGDKPTFGYDSDKWPNYVMMEGCDNGAQLVNCAVPWNDEDITMDDKKEVFLYNGDKQWEVSMGDSYIDSQLNPTISLFKELNNFCYLLNPNLKYYNGTLEQLRADNSVDTDAFYWLNKNPEAGGESYKRYDVYRSLKTKHVDGDVVTYSYTWVPAGINKVNGEYESLNLVDQLGWTPAGGSFDDINQNFINLRVKKFAEGIGKYVAVDDMKYSMQFIKLIAASDNWAKNTYIYNVGETDSDGNVTSKFRFFQDDLDTIFSLNNTGYKVKPYYVEEHDKNASNSNYWNADKNAFWCLAELAWPADLRSMTNSILSAMTKLAGSPLACFDKYYGSVTDYFPAAAYNETAKLLYEDAYHHKKDGWSAGFKKYTSSVDPLAQSVGDQAQGERQWQSRRCIYMSSYAQYGVFSAKDGSGGDGCIMFRTATVNENKPEYNFTMKPYMWLYPTMANGQSPVLPTDATNGVTIRKSPKDTVKFSFTGDGNTNVCIRGIDYYTHIGDFGQVSTNNEESFSLSGARLSEFTAKGANMTFRPNALSITGAMPAMNTLDISGGVINNTAIISGSLDLKSMPNLETVDLSSTNIGSVSLPTNSNIQTLTLPGTITELELNKQPKLTNLDIKAGIHSVSKLTMIDCDSLNTYSVFKQFYEGDVKLNNITINNINWNDFTIAELDYLLGIRNVSLTGTITLSNDQIIDFDKKMLLLDKFGNIDDPNNNLVIKYKTLQLSMIEYVKILGPNNIYVNNEEYRFSLEYPSNEAASANDFSSVQWSVNNEYFGTINTKTGVFTFAENTSITSNRRVIITCTIIQTGNPTPIKVTKTISCDQRLAQVGDYLLADGSYLSADEYLNDKPIIGICFMVDDSTDPKTQKRLAVAKNLLQLPNATKDNYGSCGWGLAETYTSKYGEIDPNIASLNNIENSGSFGNGNTNYTWYISNEAYKYVIEDPAKYESTAIGDFGWKEVGDTLVPVGKINTDAIIKYRDNILTNCRMTKPSGKDGNEFEHLNTILANNADKNEYYLYYPAASYAYAYEPNVDGLNDKFKAHNWFLPSSGELARIWYYSRQNENGSRISGFKDLVCSATTSYSDTLWSSTECTSTNGWCISFNFNGKYDYGTGYGFNGKSSTPVSLKSAKYAILPVVEF